MKTDILDYHLPPELIAQEPAEPRDSSRLLHCPLDGGAFNDFHFSDLPRFLRRGDILVTNSARVMPARLTGFKFPGGAKIEVFLLEKIPDQPGFSGERYKALLKRKRRLETGDTVLFPESVMMADVIEAGETGDDVVELNGVGDISAEIEKIGRIPLPPYITDYKGDSERYQTVYSEISGSVAAPTAGLHFTPGLLEKIAGMGVMRADVHLRVGWGTFNPIRTENLEDHSLHAETGEITDESAEKINDVRIAGGRVIAVGTTVTRILESSAGGDGRIKPFSGPTNLYITPGYRFRAIDGLITNFHLPRSSLLALVGAFCGMDRIRQAYEHAINSRYRFYSFGDAMIIL